MITHCRVEVYLYHVYYVIIVVVWHSGIEIKREMPLYL